MPSHVDRPFKQGPGQGAAQDSLLFIFTKLPVRPGIKATTCNVRNPDIRVSYRLEMRTVARQLTRQFGSVLNFIHDFKRVGHRDRPGQT